MEGRNVEPLESTNPQLIASAGESRSENPRSAIAER
jgi:hypothetical protein